MSSYGRLLVLHRCDCVAGECSPLTSFPKELYVLREEVVMTSRIARKDSAFIF